MITFEPLYELGTFLEIKLPWDEKPKRHQLWEYIVKHDGVWYRFDGLTIPEASVRKYASVAIDEAANHVE